MKRAQAALYARVSSEAQASAQTIQSQLAALQTRIKAAGDELTVERHFIDEGYSGSTLVRPALERLRDLVAAGAVDRLYIHSPDRLARKYAYQVLLVDEFQRAGVEVVFLNRALGTSPEDDLLLQVQGMIAEYERAQILERSRRGKRHKARLGSVNVLSGAPYGYRYVSAAQGGGEARYDLLPEEAEVVKQVFRWVGQERLSIGEVTRRLTRAGVPTRTGKTFWDRTSVWDMLRNPAYQGQAAFGKTRVGAMLPRLRAQRGRSLQPRRAQSSYDVPREEWQPIPVPAMVDEALFAAVDEQLQENRRRARARQRGARYLLQGLLTCARCGYAYYGKAISPSARKYRPRRYAYYRCIGTDAYRFGGQRVCSNTQVRTDLLEEAVWEQVCALLENPGRLAEEYTRRLQVARSGAGDEVCAALEKRIVRLRQGIARLIDSYAEGYLDKSEFEPRIRGMKERVQTLEGQAKQLAEQATWETELQLVIGRLDEFSARVIAGVETLDWFGRRDLLRTLVKRVDIDQTQINVVFRVEAPLPGSGGSGFLQHCRGRVGGSPGRD
jgi:site-specific DNA recombinase